jgi:dienelactone hydrolase
LGPGTWLYGGSKALMRRVLASNTQVNVFHTGFKACDSYAGAEAAMAQVTCPTLFVLGNADQMTPPKATATLKTVAQAAGVSNTVQSYSIAGRSEEFFANGDLQGTIDGMWSQLNALMYGNATLADLRRNVLEDGSTT